MNNNTEYRDAYTKARANYADLKERGAEAEGDSVLKHLETILTPEETAAADRRIAAIGERNRTNYQSGTDKKRARA